MVAAAQAPLTKRRVRGQPDRPRLCVHISNRHVTAQVIDDQNGRTLAYVTTLGSQAEGSLSAKAGWAGAEIANRAKKAKIKQVVFDRSRRRYHGRVKTLAEAARAKGLEF